MRKNPEKTSPRKLVPTGDRTRVRCMTGAHAKKNLHTFFTTQGRGGPPRMRDQVNAGAASEITQTCKTINTIHAHIHSNKADMKGWLCRPNDIRGPCGPKAAWRLTYRWGKTPKKTSPTKLVPTGHRTRARCVTGAHATVCSTAGGLRLYVQSSKIVNSVQFPWFHIV